MTILTNPGSVVFTTAYRTTAPVVAGSTSTNGYLDGTIGGVAALGSALPTVPVFDNATIAGFFEYKDAAGASHIVLAMLGVQKVNIFDSVRFPFGNAQYNLYYDAATFSTAQIAGYSTWDWLMPANVFGIVAGSVAFTIEDLTDDFNCNCVTGSESTIFKLDTLANLTNRLAIRLGYASQIGNLPVGLSTLCTEYLNNAQSQIDIKFNAMNRERFFKWTMVPGQRYYGIANSEGGCSVLLDPYQITWAGFEDLNKAWYDLVRGIPPVMYTRAQTSPGWPARYEIKQCIEIFPAPQAAYTLWIKGQFLTVPMVAAGDLCAFDSEMILMLAVGNAKTDKGQAGAQLALQQATSRLGGLVAASHLNARYIPGTKVLPVATPPIFPLKGPQ